MKPTKAAEEVLRFLRLIAKPDEITELFVKGAQVDGETDVCQLIGYYDTRHLHVLVEDALTWSGHAAAIYYRLNSLQPAALSRSRNTFGYSYQVQASSCKDITQRRLLMVDIDPLRGANPSATKDEKDHAHRKTIEVRTYLRGLAWPAPITIDTGNGYCLLYAIALPKNDGDLIKRVLQALSNRYSDVHSRIDSSVYDPARLARLPGTLNCKGLQSEARPHRVCRILAIPKILKRTPKSLLELVASKLNKSTDEGENPKRISSSQIERARRYVAKMEPAIAGRRGHDQTFKVACRLTIMFQLTVEQAWPIMKSYNQRCQPPWDDIDLRRKLHEAMRTSKVRDDSRERGVAVQKVLANEYDVWQPLDGAEFAGYVPDFGVYDILDVMLPLSKFEKRPWHRWVDRFAAASLKSNDIVVPDVLLRQTYWGGTYPRNWRRELRTWRHHNMLELEPIDQECREDLCLLAKSGIKHRHFNPHLWDIGFLEIMIPRSLRASSDYIQFNSPLTHEQAVYLNEYLSMCRKAARLAPIYWPGLLFGSSPRVGWTMSQRRLLVAIVREVTRSRSGCHGEAEKTFGNRVIGASRREQIVICPVLDPSTPYVTFGGNKLLRGRGYKLVGRTFGGWLARAGYSESEPPYQRDIGRLLEDASRLANDLDLIAVGYNPANRFHQWRNTKELCDSTRSRAGREWLMECNIRFYAPADWLVRWRYFFSHKLGFRWIPRTVCDPGPADEPPEFALDRIRYGTQVRALLENERMTQGEFATFLTNELRRPVSRQFVNSVINGGARSDELFQAAERLRQRSKS